MSKGFIKLNRKFFDNHFWNEDRTYSLAEAWIDLIQSARFEVAPKKIVVKMKTITINRGELRASQRYLANRWKWSVGKTNRFLKLLQSEQMITRRNEHSETIIKLCKYDNYNSYERTPMNTDEHTNRHTNGTPTEHRQIQSKERKELKERKILFKERVFKFNKYPHEILKKFFEYWSEENFEKQKMLFELKEVFNLKTRLERWVKQEKEWQKQKNEQKNGQKKPYRFDLEEVAKQLGDTNFS